MPEIPVNSEAGPGSLQQLEERKNKVVQSRMVQLRKISGGKGALMAREEQKLRTLSGKLKKAILKLVALLAETGKETIKEHIPEVARARSSAACDKALYTYRVIQQSIQEKNALNVVDDLSAGVEAVKNIEANQRLLQAIVDSLPEGCMGNNELSAIHTRLA